MSLPLFSWLSFRWRCFYVIGTWANIHSAIRSCVCIPRDQSRLETLSLDQSPVDALSGRPIAGRLVIRPTNRRPSVIWAANERWRPVLFQPHEASNKIYQTGCLTAGEAWVERNLLVVAGVAVGVAFLQVGKPVRGLSSKG